MNNTPSPPDEPEPAPLRLAEFLPYRLSVVSELTSRLFADRYERAFGLSIPEWRVMAVLGEAASLSTQDVIEATAMDRVRVSRAAIRLAGKGLLTRRAQAGDKRAQTLRLSRRGRDTYRQVVPLARALQAELAARLEPAELRDLDRLLDKLRAGTVAAARRSGDLTCAPGGAEGDRLIGDEIERGG